MRRIALVTSFVLCFAGSAYGVRAAEVCTMGQMGDGGTCCCRVEMPDCQPGDEFPAAPAVSASSRQDLKRPDMPANVETSTSDLSTDSHVARSGPLPDEGYRIRRDLRW